MYGIEGIPARSRMRATGRHSNVGLLVLDGRALAETQTPGYSQTFEHSLGAWILAHLPDNLPHTGGHKWNGVSLLDLPLTLLAIPR